MDPKVKLGGPLFDMIKPDANSKQVGGEHYRSEYQHWDFIELNGIGYLEAAATKYATRWRKKNGLEDLQKALHYTEKLIELHAAGRRLPRGIASAADVVRFAEANELSATEITVVHSLSRWSCAADLLTAKEAIERLMKQAMQVQPYEGKTEAPK